MILCLHEMTPVQRLLLAKTLAICHTNAYNRPCVAWL